MRKSETMAFRCTEDLKKKIRKQANENGIPLSRFIERKLSEPDPETIPEIKELKNCFIKTQNEINEIARACVGNENFSAEDYQKIMEKLNVIDKKYYDLIMELQKKQLPWAITFFISPFAGLIFFQYLRQEKNLF